MAHHHQHTVETLGYDREALFPKYHADIATGRALLIPADDIEAAQDRVVMRRHLRKKHSDVLGEATLSLMGGRDLSALITAIEGV